MSNINDGILNKYTITPNSLTKYTAFRGVTDFTQIGQFAQFETGYSFLRVIKLPEFMLDLGRVDPGIAQMNEAFQHMLEFEFRGIDGLPDVQADTYEITDGINTQRLINKVTEDTAVTVSSPYFEKTGSLITKWSEIYLTGIKDRATQAKTYHGLIRNGIGCGKDYGPDQEVFTMLYYVTDSTMLRLEKAYLLCNCQLTKAEKSIYNSTKGDINNKELSIEWNCFPITGYEVDKAAKYLLEDMTGVPFDTKGVAQTPKAEEGKNSKYIVLDAAAYKYNIFTGDSADNNNYHPAQSGSLQELVTASASV